MAGVSMFRCKACYRPFPTQEEAELCTPREEWPERYPHRTETEDAA